MDHLSERWQREAERLHHRYLIEVVEACGLCPWAERARKDGRTRVAVLLQVDDAAIAPASAVMDEWADDGELEVGFLIFPRLPLGRADFDRFVSRLRSADVERRPPGEAPFALAAFHPDAAPQLDDPERLIPFLRRTPDPCIQVVRMSILKRVRSGTSEGTQFIDIKAIEAALSDNASPPLRERIARANLHAVRRMGVAQLEDRIGHILRDRDQSYASLGAFGAPARGASEPP
jgi:hypothetical protein